MSSFIQSVSFGFRQTLTPSNTRLPATMVVRFSLSPSPSFPGTAGLVREFVCCAIVCLSELDVQKAYCVWSKGTILHRWIQWSLHHIFCIAVGAGLSCLYHESLISTHPFHCDFFWCDLVYIPYLCLLTISPSCCGFMCHVNGLLCVLSPLLCSWETKLGKHGVYYVLY